MRFCCKQQRQSHKLETANITTSCGTLPPSPISRPSPHAVIPCWPEELSAARSSNIQRRKKSWKYFQKTWIQWWHIHYDTSITIWLMAYFYKKDPSFPAPPFLHKCGGSCYPEESSNGQCPMPMPHWRSISIHRCLCCAFQTFQYLGQSMSRPMLISHIKGVFLSP